MTRRNFGFNMKTVLNDLEKQKPLTIGFLQALFVTLYCGIIAFTIFHLPKDTPDPGFLGFFVGLLVLVCSAAITGSLVLGYPAYLAFINKDVKRALTILAYTLTFALIFAISITSLIFAQM